jgi:protein gp37
MRLAGTRLAHHPSRAGLTRDSKAGPVWTGETRLNEAWLTQPLRWRRPRRIFVCAHGDLFAESVPDEWIDRVFAVMALAPQHTFQVLTKRAKRMRKWASAPDRLSRIAARAFFMEGEFQPQWPLPNVWLGVSVEDQMRADERIPDLLATPAAVRFVSAEPLLGPIDFRRVSPNGVQLIDTLIGRSTTPDYSGWPRLDWIIVGGESGPGARPMHPDWARAIRDQCAAAGVAFFFKQNGEWQHMPERAHFKEQFREEWRLVESGIPGVRPALMFRVGKKRAGRLLDGYTHDDMPGSRATL